MKKVRVDLVARYTVVVGVNESDCIYDDAADLALKFVSENPSIIPSWEVEDDGVDDADEDEEVDVFQNID